MAGGFKWDFAANVQPFLRSTDQVGDALDEVKDSLVDVAKKGDDAQRDLERSFKNLSRPTEEVRQDIERIGDDATTTGRKAERAFDQLARDARDSARKVDQSTDKMKESLGGIGDEARSEAREMGASFSEGGDISDGLQSLVSNSGQYFGPLGDAFAAAMAVGIGLFMADMEAMKQDVADIFDDMLESGSAKLSKAAVDARIQQSVSDDPMGFAKENKRIESLIKTYKLQGLAVEDVIRSKNGDAEATRRVTDALAKNERRLQATTDAAGNYVDGNEVARDAVRQLSVEVNKNAEAYGYASRALDYTRRSTDQTKTSVEKVEQAFGKARAEMGDPITAEIRVKAPSPAELRMLRAGIQAGLGTLVVPVKAGQTRFSNTSSNSRYRN